MHAMTHMKEEPYPMQVPPLAQGPDAQTSSWHWKTFLPDDDDDDSPLTLDISGRMTD